MRIKSLVLALVATLICGAELSAQNNQITPVPAVVRGGVCNGEVCVPAEPFDYTQPFKLTFEGVDAVDIERLTSAAVAAGLNVKRVEHAVNYCEKGLSSYSYSSRDVA